METVQQNGRFTLFCSKFHSDIYSILFGLMGRTVGVPKCAIYQAATS